MVQSNDPFEVSYLHLLSFSLSQSRILDPSDWLTVLVVLPPATAVAVLAVRELDALPPGSLQGGGEGGEGKNGGGESG